MEPYSLLLGHLPLLKGLKEGLPSDAHSIYSQLKIVENWQKYFPGESKCPPLIYLDAWPFMPQAIILVISPELCAQLTQEKPQPRHPMFRFLLTPVTGGKDLISMDMAEHRLWRSRLNPGFSSRNLVANMPALLEESAIFAQHLKELASEDDNWGAPFALYDKAVALTFDIIIRIAL
jgi:cytochrome P450